MRRPDSRLSLLAFLFAVSLVIYTFGVPAIKAFPQYAGNSCDNCHGDFDDDTSPQGTLFPGDSKHTMHLSGSSMNTECNLCHTSLGDNPMLDSSAGTANNPGIGCNGCHEAKGLRLHHFNSGISCAPCHSPQPAPPENTVPVYYGTPDTNANDPCNPDPASNTNENWSLGDFQGQDNDGDLLYDSADPDCAATISPGEASRPDPQAQQMTVAHAPQLNQVTITYTVPCGATDHTIEYGPLDQVGAYAYGGQTCNVGVTGETPWTYPAGSTFFVIVANDGTNEGSYGVDSAGVERPEDNGSTCPLPQNLDDRCD